MIIDVRKDLAEGTWTDSGLYGKRPRGLKAKIVGGDVQLAIDGQETEDVPREV